MWLQKHNCDKKDGVHGIVAVGIDSDKGSQNALKWTIDHLLPKGSNVVLIHVKTKPSSLHPSVSLGNPSKYSLWCHPCFCQHVLWNLQWKCISYIRWDSFLKAEVNVSIPLFSSSENGFWKTNLSLTEIRMMEHKI